MKFLKVLNVLNPLLYYYKYSYRHRFPSDPYKQITKLTQNFQKKEELKKKVLIVPFRVSPVSNLFEGNCSLILKSRGYHVDALMCGQSVGYCDQIDFSLSKNLRCNLCFYEQQKFIKAYGVQGIFIEKYVSSDEKKRIRDEIETMNLNEINEHFSYKGVPVYRSLSSAVMLYFKSADFSLQDNTKELKGFLETIFLIITALENYFSENKVEFVLLSHGVYSTWGTVQEYCLSRGIKFVTWGREYHGAGVIAAHNASYLSEPLHESPSEWINKPLSAKQRAEITEYLQAKVGIGGKRFDYVSYYADSQKSVSKEEIYSQLNIKSDKPIVALLSSIPWDGQTFRPNIFFDDINAWVYETIDWFAKRNDCILIIRAHPAEKHADGGNGGGLFEVLEKRYGSVLPENIIFVPPESKIRSISIASISCAALLYGSTIGYETTFLKIPTILASEFFYTNKGITFDPKTKEDYFALITAAIEGNLQVDAERFERLLQYAYHYQFRRIMPETLMDLNGLNFIKYKYTELKDFVNDEVINKFIDKCITGEKFYFDDCYD
ncbi:hypothetical protein OQJ18_11555 [Fluoribacter dumoffii]|uniref:Capsule polysaccharide biosynthesis protein n=1 Tax=Fluoribacter dumoffii TaxID=463 RepID=A0A377G642_9GAMM|nr:hypothetical protein [Fluoribacter dumoffii]KTC91652.1 hypothetical protein Ldum_2720 [Fluoribacter dumoffii NY 23]MCW8387223.1 hypothetical protein [Fluoribacter dumoffii]MCW8417271.1 hypothetical protein [Fluoribacter dumoffii]MCW8454888.1 hypothetical protein [Fluoribacter dumoffii]MCW8461035.1 hypothetical protein [Fluoribacter dumoffii]